MPAFDLPSSALIPAFNALSNLQPWLRPGLFAYVIGEHADALRPHATRLFVQRDGMLDAAALKYPDVYSDTEGDESLRGQPHPKAGQRIIRPGPGGAEITLFKSKDLGDDFIKREAEMMAAIVQITVSMRLTLDFIKHMDTERLDVPRTINGTPPSTDYVDFGALVPLIEKPMHDANGVVVGSIPPSVPSPLAAGA